jgi:hypothetical protein
MGCVGWSGHVGFIDGVVVLLPVRLNGLRVQWEDE